MIKSLLKNKEVFHFLILQLNSTIQKQKVLVLVIFSFFFAPMVPAQKSDFGNWLLYIGNKKINNKWNIHNEIQYRNYNFIGDLEQLLLRVGAGYTFNASKNNVLLGYGYILSENYSTNNTAKEAVNEHRIFQQFIARQAIGSVALQHRYRLEQRFIEKDFKFRFRYFLGITIPFQKKQENTIYVSLYNEIFLNSETPVFDRNRTFGGLGYKINQNIKLEVGYMNQFFNTTSRDQFNLITFINF